jgi:iron complex outermembrane receptor protein
MPCTARRLRSSSAIISLIFGATLHAGIAQAQVQPAPSEDGGDIVVTAQKREQRLQDVAVAVNAYSGDQLENLNVRESVDIARLTPGVAIATSSGGHLQQFTIRGVAQNDFYDGAEAPIAVYVDEAYIATQQGQTFGLFDLERVEVLKGPQGTLFGRNATGGLVHYITKKPKFDRVEGYAAVSIGSYESKRAEGAVNLPLSDRVATRFAGYYEYQGHYVKNLYPLGQFPANSAIAGGGSDLGGKDGFGLRGQILAKLNDTTEFLLSVHGTRNRYSESPYESRPSIAQIDAQGREVNAYLAGPNETREAIGPNGEAVDIFFGDGGFLDPQPGIRPVAGGDLFGFRDTNLGDNRTSQDYAFNRLDRDSSYGATGRLTAELGGVTLTSITDAAWSKKFQSLDIGAAPANQALFMTQSKSRNWSEELRLTNNGDRFNWITGAYYLYIHSDTRNGQAFPAQSINTAFLKAVGTTGIDNGLDQVGLSSITTRSASVFGQIGWKFADQWTLQLGGRYINERKRFIYEQNGYANIDDRTIDTTTLLFPIRVPGPGITNPYTDRHKQNLWAGKAQLEWRPQDGILLYAGVSRGTKAGSYNAPLPLGDAPVPDSQLRYEPEEITDYEAGLKTSWLDGKLRAKLSAFYYDYKDHQVFRFSGVAGIVVNKPASSKGAEFEIAASPLPGLDLLLNAAYHKAKVRDVEVAAGIFRDVNPVFSPEKQVSGTARYEWAGLGGLLSLQIDGSYSSGYYTNIKNFDSYLLPGRTVFNLGAGWKSADERFDFSLSVKNLFKKRYITEAFNLETFCGCDEALYGKPRWVTGTLRVNF